MVYHLQSTNLCYVESEKNRRCSYPENECSKCTENASLINSVCQCDSNYFGIGYINCNKENETIEGNNFYFILY